MNWNLQHLLVAAMALADCGVCLAQAEALPLLRDRDTWSYRQSTARPKQKAELREFRVSVSANADGSMYATQAGAERAQTQTVWNILGAFPAGTCMRDLVEQTSLELDDICTTALAPKKQWASLEADRASGIKKKYVVKGREQVVVPAGSFSAIRIDADETRTAERYPGLPPPAGGYQKRLRTTYWYAPEVRGFVKIVREKRRQNGSLEQTVTEVLTRFQGH